MTFNFISHLQRISVLNYLQLSLRLHKKVQLIESSFRIVSSHAEPQENKTEKQTGRNEEEDKVQNKIFIRWKKRVFSFVVSFEVFLFG
ncbi:CLUMA_CG007830, isoform A [Clunio marinus]|uniref:CLUMA_CG007830, isoform A n=1 Tax=Clunio marinus TaxID=568069 RepID=A0A1J1I277_9DIPT|nr:CLUMA_CG007830, isoform A [Clunio marinus]